MRWPMDGGGMPGLADHLAAIAKRNHGEAN